MVQFRKNDLELKGDTIYKKKVSVLGVHEYISFQ